jgi:phosphoglycerate dehydrogenase-like enzyme
MEALPKRLAEADAVVLLLLITPHVAGAVMSWRLRAYRFASEQVRCFSAGTPLRNLVAR